MASSVPSKRSALKDGTSASQLTKYPPQILENYVIKDTIGSGGFAKVKLARHKLSEEKVVVTAFCVLKSKVAIKVMDKEALRKTHDLERVALEIEALKTLHHQNIARLYEVVETEEKFFLVLEYAPGGELFDYIVARERLKEAEARVFFRQIVSAVAYCHAHGYVHRDLKPENLLLDGDQNIKLIDFGLISHPADIRSSRLTTCCGSAAYAAPELIRGDPYLGPPADVWSLGILLYALLCGFLPFDDENTQRLYRLIQRGQYEVPLWLSDDTTKLLDALLRHKPEQRLTIPQLLCHPWMLKGLEGVDRIDASSTCEEDRPLNETVVAQLAKFHGVDTSVMEARIKERLYDQLTASYELLALRASRGRPIRLPAAKGHHAPGRAMALLHSQSRQASSTSDSEFVSSSMPSIPARLLDGAAADDSLNMSTASTGKMLSPLSDKQRWASQGEGLNTGRSVLSGSQPDLSGRGMAAPAEPGAAAEAPKRTLGGSLRNLARSIQGLFGSRNLDEPRVIKGPFSMSTTSTKTPLEVKAEVLRVLDEQHLDYKETGFVIKARILDPETGKERIAIRLEVCRVQRVDLTGIKLTRMKGDTWAYKRVCTELVAAMKL